MSYVYSMRILFVNHFPLTGSGSGVYTANIAKALIRAGHEVAIVFPENRSEYETYEKIKLYPVFFLNNESISDNEQLDFNFPCFTTHPRSTMNFAKMTENQKEKYVNAFKKKINEAIEEFNPDVVHAQHIWTLAGVSAECCKKFKIPMIATCHGTDLMGIQKEKENNISWGTNWAKKAVEYANAIITISADSNELAEQLIPEIKGKSKFIRNGVDTTVFYLDNNLNKNDVLHELGIERKYEKVVSFVGKLTEFKGVDVLLEAAAKYEDNNTLTLIAGDGVLKQSLMQQAEELGLKNVVFLGNRPQSILNKIYNIADCSCVPSRREPFGLVAAEAMACGTPVVATNEGGLPDFVTEDVGILVNVNDSTGLAKAIKDILLGNIKFDKEVSSKKIQEMYSQDAIVNEFFMDLYKMPYKV